MKELFEKQFEGRQLRHRKDLNGDTWFVAKDVCEILDIANHKDAMKNVDDRGKVVDSIDSLGGLQSTWLVNKSGLYDILMQSRKPIAKRFKTFINYEVMPSLEKTGSYSMHERTPAQQLLAQAQYMVDVEQQAQQALKAVAKVEKEQAQISTKVDGIAKTVGQMTRLKQGTEKLPDGLISVQRLSSAFFPGVNPAVVSEYLKAINHPTQLFTYTIENTYHYNQIFEKEGLHEAADRFVRGCTFVKETDKNIQVKNPMIVGEFRFKKELTPQWIIQIILGDRLKLVKPEPVT